MSFYLVTEKWKDKHVMCSKVQPTNNWTKESKYKKHC